MSLDAATRPQHDGVGDTGRVTSAPLSPTDRTTVTRGRKRARTDRAELLALLAEVLVGHLGVVVDGEPRVLPVAFAVDEDGPDDGGTVYVHGSVAAGWLRSAGGATVCLTVTALDGLVTARSGFHHSMNYRSGVVIGAARVVTDADELARALDLTVDHMVPGRSATLRAHTRRELAATAVLAVPMREASLKARSGGPVDDGEDVEAGVWAGHVPLRLVAGDVVPDPEATGPVPADVADRVASLREPTDR